MTTVEYGGGPTLEQKRAFAGLKEGAHIPGYRGYCPQLKFSIGKTYGAETSELALTRRCPRHQTEDQTPAIGKFQFSGRLPLSTGDNKYMENMTSGYTGYVPRWPFQFGKTYQEECDVCLAEFLTEQNKLQMKTPDMARSLPSLRPISGDPTVRDRLNEFHERGSHLSAGETRRLPTEAPIPGYRGYIPRVRTTELGLGSRYHDMTKSGLDSFYSARYEREQKYGPLPDNYGAQRYEPPRFKRSLTTIPRIQGDTQTCRTMSGNRGSRLYARDGMIPNYNGFVPQQRYSMGYTFGDETRSLEVCAHDQKCYGDYVNQQQQQQQRV